ncbi:MAG: 4-hydroxy-tetrahydrodipicolinate synthase [Rhizobiales bacterium 62-17]|nr:MAG: 4-hydroxy-tetrahydrodipicolinate synthase [Rhizobiales bacterium 62-17]
MVDHAALEALIEWQISEGIQGLIPCGAAGEVPTLSCQEHIAVIRRCIEISAGRCPIIAGTGTNNTQTTIDLTATAKSLGASAALLTTPYYNRPNQEGLFRHFEAVARSVDIPIIIQNVPSRTGVDLSLETLKRLASLPTIVGLADTTGDLSRPFAVSHLLGDRFLQLSGHDATALGFSLLGGQGAISVVANIAPKTIVEMQTACRTGDVRRARSIESRLRPLIAALDLEPSPAPAKFALHLLRGLSPDARLPLIPVCAHTALAIEAALSKLVGADDHSTFNPPGAFNQTGMKPRQSSQTPP